MELWQILIILMVLAVIIGNLMLLKHSAKIGFKVPKKKRLVTSIKRLIMIFNSPSFSPTQYFSHIAIYCWELNKIDLPESSACLNGVRLI